MGILSRLVRSSNLEKLGIPLRRINHLCDKLGFEKPGKGRSRFFTKDEAMILLLASHITDTCGMGNVQKMMRALKKVKPKFGEVKTLAWELEKGKANCLVNKDGNAPIVYIVDFNRLLPEEIRSL